MADGKSTVNLAIDRDILEKAREWSEDNNYTLDAAVSMGLELLTDPPNAYAKAIESIGRFHRFLLSRIEDANERSRRASQLKQELEEQTVELYWKGLTGTDGSGSDVN